MEGPRGVGPLVRFPQLVIYAAINIIYRYRCHSTGIKPLKSAPAGNSRVLMHRNLLSAILTVKTY
jgi:hypothetical protein